MPHIYENMDHFIKIVLLCFHIPYLVCRGIISLHTNYNSNFCTQSTSTNLRRIILVRCPSLKMHSLSLTYFLSRVLSPTKMGIYETPWLGW